MTDNGRTVRELFDGYAVEFSSIYGGPRGCFARLMDKWFRKSMLVRFHKSIGACQPLEGRRVLDVGCGPGHYSVLLARQGASCVLGVDFSTSMIELAQKRALEHQVSDKCEFIEQDIRDYQTKTLFDYTIVMGVMDYIQTPQPFITHLMEMTKGRIMFSFPERDGFLAFQRRLRYRWFADCELRMYTQSSLEELMSQVAPGRHTIEKIERDFFVVIDMGHQENLE